MLIREEGWTVGVSPLVLVCSGLPSWNSTAWGLHELGHASHPSGGWGQDLALVDSLCLCCEGSLTGLQGAPPHWVYKEGGRGGKKGREREGGRWEEEGMEE